MDNVRHAQIDLLKAEGWTFDRETRLLQGADHVINGPTYIKAPDGRLHKLNKGVVAILEGRYRRLGAPTGIQQVIYRAGILAEINGQTVAQKTT